MDARKKKGGPIWSSCLPHCGLDGSSAELRERTDPSGEAVYLAAMKADTLYDRLGPVESVLCGAPPTQGTTLVLRLSAPETSVSVVFALGAGKASAPRPPLE